MKTYVDIIGFIGSFTLSSMAIPQIITTYKRKSAEDISYGMLFLLLLGYSVMMAYGVLLPSLPIVTSLCLSIFNNIVLIVLKIKYDGSNILAILPIISM